MSVPFRHDARATQGKSRRPAKATDGIGRPPTEDLSAIALTGAAATFGMRREKRRRQLCPCKACGAVAQPRLCRFLLCRFPDARHADGTATSRRVAAQKGSLRALRGAAFHIWSACCFPKSTLISLLCWPCRLSSLRPRAAGSPGWEPASEIRTKARTVPTRLGFSHRQPR